MEDAVVVRRYKQVSAAERQPMTSSASRVLRCSSSTRRRARPRTCVEVNIPSMELPGTNRAKAACWLCRHRLGTGLPDRMYVYLRKRNYYHMGPALQVACRRSRLLKLYALPLKDGCRVLRRLNPRHPMMHIRGRAKVCFPVWMSIALLVAWSCLRTSSQDSSSRWHSLR